LVSADREDNDDEEEEEAEAEEEEDDALGRERDPPVVVFGFDFAVPGGAPPPDIFRVVTPSERDIGVCWRASLRPVRKKSQ